MRLGSWRVNMPDVEQPKKQRSGGPKTPEGKERSRGNATKHGNRSVQCLILPDETMEEYTELRASWLQEFEPENFTLKVLVDELIRAHWLFKRAQRRLLETEFAIAGDENVTPVDWDAEDEHKIELMQRYKTSAERAFYRALNAARQQQKDDLNNLLRLRKMGTDLLKLRQEWREIQARLEAEPGPKLTEARKVSARSGPMISQFSDSDYRLTAGERLGVLFEEASFSRLDDKQHLPTRSRANVRAGR